MSSLQRKEVGSVESLVVTVLGDELSGTRGEWLDRCLFSVAPSGYAAIAKGSKIAWKHLADATCDVVIEDIFDGELFEDSITALQWIEVEYSDPERLPTVEDTIKEDEGRHPKALQALIHQSKRNNFGSTAATASVTGMSCQVALAVGCASGQVKLFNLKQEVLLAQFFELSPVKRLRVRGHGGLDGSQDLLVIYDESVVVRIDGATLFRLFADASAVLETGVDHGKWKLSTQEGMSDAVCCGLDATAEGGDFWGAAYYKLIAAGASPSLSVFAVCDERHHASAKEMVSKLASAAFSIAKSYLWGAPSDHDDKDDAAAPARPTVEDARSVSASDALDDPKRVVRDVFLEPHCRVAAAADSLGRVMVVDVEDFVVVRLFKGYREPQCAWVLEERSDTDPAGTGQDSEEGAGEGGGREGEGSLCLLLFAPRRSILEAWRLGSGERVGVQRVSGKARLLQLPRALRQYQGDDTHDHEGELRREESDQQGAEGPSVTARRRAEAESDRAACCAMVEDNFVVAMYRVVAQP